MDVSLILPTKDGAGCLGDVLERVFAQEVTPEVLVIDSGSTDGTLEVARRFPVRLIPIDPRDFGHGRTRNLGASLATGRHLVFLSQDASPADARWLRRLLDNLESGDVAGVFSRQVPRPGANALERHFLERTYPARREVRRLDAGVRATFRASFFSNVGSAVRRDVWDAHRFREDLVMSEDQAWARQALESGHTLVYEPEARVLHSHHYTLGAVFRRNFDSGFSIRQIFGPRLGHTGGDTLRFLRGEFAALARQGAWGTIPYGVAYELARIGGFGLGYGIGTRLPAGVCRRLGQCRPFWEAYARRH